ncbi:MULTISPECIES: RNA polymerase factor sigma-70 [Burkholderia]|uniref:RNA polymerase subunit sigma-70 n=1 Tax=Burkholderia savannae TaxID=1637837 RepID=A0ABR5TDM1_9BURK|nr:MULTISPECIES: RNA polymerase factor sigma-70 [Burkholderia]AOJ68900.1 RNA polymerase subunit sigma-70 [Burkholderia savannae]AOJ80880.1 RNA polymerase subunit sigma-70 [Burkholderia savannae]AOK47116.1 RNA polymerase subunit sigma-70 [Burkholderia sp. MSMB617WGS]KVG37838.1 RNA polymerase subunit sigma-70 [Burkholderia sp. MSMB0265]KVG78160.1 RNA polymerase subunit sigma-70 [Burkholderia sp. MSMB2040]
MAAVLARPAPAKPLPIPDSHAVLPPGPRAASAPAHGALVDVLVANRPMLVKLARGFVGCASRAEDVVHDVFVKLVDFPNQEAIRQPVAYVTRMVRNASIDACRRQTLENTYHADEDDGLDVPSPELSPEAALVVRDTLRHVYDALAQLPARSRAAFEMVRLREETLQSAARALNVSQTLVHFMVRDAERHCMACVDASERGLACPAFCGGRARGR